MEVVAERALSPQSLNRYKIGRQKAERRSERGGEKEEGEVEEEVWQSSVGGGGGGGGGQMDRIIFLPFFSIYYERQSKCKHTQKVVNKKEWERKIRYLLRGGENYHQTTT